MTTKSYISVTLSYWVFMLTDGALRMLVLLHFHELGFTPDKLAFLFLLYEVAGIATNLFGGWMGSRFGLKSTLFFGLGFQIAALLGLTLFQESWTILASVIFVMAVQALSGVAKDLTKMSSKSSVKLLVSEDNESGLFKLVAILTGSKNAIKGIGFFLGAFLLASIGFDPALYILAGLTALALILSLCTVRGDFGKMKTKVKFSQLFSKSSAINRLSIARAALFASRDVWFVVGLPIFLHDQLNWTFSQVGGFMATWVIGYGIVQASAPRISGAKAGLKQAVSSLKTWAFLLVGICAALTASIHWNFHPTTSLLIGLGIFGLIFAVNSSIHSYLILAYTKTEEVALNVGFYYMANACGRLIGTLLSGLAYLFGGLTACLITSTLLALAAALGNLLLPDKSTNQDMTI
ncbi:MAG: organoarsenical effux MFS transporter ArsJ [Akkermansiaceae bacterium]